ncbi:MAG: hypothetical protein WCL32_24105, partial [Planctomycetota bacterium]
DGPPPGYKWNVAILEVSYSEASEFLDPDQYAHMASLVRELARQDDATHSKTIDVRPVQEFFEIRDKGGILGKKNVRVFYFVEKRSRSIVILGAFKKEAEGATPVGVRLRMRRRMRLYMEKHFPQ